MDATYRAYKKMGWERHFVILLKNIPNQQTSC
jgi:hypothetical protein